DHYYRGLTFSDVPEKNMYAFVSGKPGAETRFPDLAKLPDDEPPQTVVTFVGSLKEGKRLIRGTASDNREVKEVTVNGQPAKSLRGDYSEWQIELPLSSSDKAIKAQATDASGNIEPRPHVV